MNYESLVEPASPLRGGQTLPDGDVRELLGLLAYTELMAFDRLALTSSHAPVLPQRSRAARFASDAVRRHAWLLDRVADLGGDPTAALGAFEGLFDEYRRRTEPSGWYERLLKGYVGDGVMDDLCHLAVRALDPESRSALEAVILDGDAALLADEEIVTAAAQDPILASRLALWGRRLVGEALGVVQTLMSTRPWLARMIVAGAEQDGEGGAAGTDPQAWLIARLTAEHTRRMDRLGLAA
ncbi:ferritin-like fold-containing protein [Paraoerskovia marina]|uniref:tRNA-(MS[2]IO[6]A)-hydroxylase (MiaE)-like n=1 Tax=Paraoerskovia marina TaxID=545619 RepID=A0A1H1UX02_9CELL|nr:ferritin-like fold-containing protein [Paraoerskovia marina]SDS77025.1 tRNA-(MS[2]IO[6]A)-hydroxylase (MiaE)-like [Paraoerskovia marina]